MPADTAITGSQEPVTLVAARPAINNTPLLTAKDWWSITGSFHQATTATDFGHRLLTTNLLSNCIANAAGGDNYGGCDLDIQHMFPFIGGLVCSFKQRARRFSHK